MYKSINPIELLMKPAEKTVFSNDRKNYLPVLAAVEKFCSQNKLIIGGTMGINILVGNDPDISDYSYILYAENGSKTSRELADYIYSNVSSDKMDMRTITVETNIKNDMFTIWLNVRPIVTIYNLGFFRKIPIFDLIGPVEKSPMFFRIYRDNYCNIEENPEEFKVLVISEELQLIQIYRELYRPYPTTKFYTEYPDLMKYEKMLFDEIKGNITSRIIGADESNDISGSLSEKFINNFAKNSDILVIGDFAAEKFTGISMERKRLQIIFDGDIHRLNDQISKLFGETHLVRYDLKIPGDKLLIKHTIYLKKSNEDIVLAEVFNSTSYELVPYTEFAGTKYAGVYVIMRFKMIDLYIMKILLRLGSLKKKTIENVIGITMHQLGLLREYISGKIESDPFEIFQIRDFAGIYIPENIIRKKMSKNVFLPRYYPAKK